MAGRSAVPRGDPLVDSVGCDGARHRARAVVGDRGRRPGRGIQPHGLRALLLRADAHQPAHHRVGLVVPRPLDPQRRAELPAGAAPEPGARGDRRQPRLQGAQRGHDPRRLARRRRRVAGGAAAARPRPLGPDDGRRRARGGDAVLHQLRHRADGVLDDARDRDHGAARGAVAVPGRPDCAARAAAARRGERGRCAVVSLHARVPREPAHRGRAESGGVVARIRGAGRLAPVLARGVPAGVEPRDPPLRSGGRMSARRPRRTPRWLRVLGALWRLNVAEELQYRANLVASVLGTVLYMGWALLTLALFFRHTQRLGGWDYWEVVVLLGVFNALSGVIEAVLRPGIGQLAGEVRSGHLDLVLSRPVDAQAFVSFRKVDVWRLTDGVLGLALAGYALGRLGRAPSALQLGAFVVALASARP